MYGPGPGGPGEPGGQLGVQSFMIPGGSPGALGLLKYVFQQQL